MSADVKSVFKSMPGAMDLYGSIERLLMSLPGVAVEVKKTQAGFRHRKMFAWVWLPIRKVRGRPDVYVVLSIRLRRKICSARVAEAVEPYPGRWVNHIIVTEESDLDDELLRWLEEAYEFATR